MLSNKNRGSSLHTRHRCWYSLRKCSACGWWDRFENPTGNSEIAFAVPMRSSSLRMRDRYSNEAKEVRRGWTREMEDSNRLPWLTGRFRSSWEVCDCCSLFFFCKAISPVLFPVFHVIYFLVTLTFIVEKQKVSSSKDDSSMWKGFSRIWVHIL